MRLLIYCAGGLGKEVTDLAEEINSVYKKWDEIGFIDDVIEDRVFYHKKVYRFDEVMKLKEINEIEVIIANGEPSNRLKLWNKLKEQKVPIATLVHPRAYISPTAKIGQGVIVKGESSISSDVIIGNNVYIQPHSTIGHDSKIGEHTIVSCFVSVAGGCFVGERVYIGTGTLIKDHLTVGNDSILAMGSTIIRNVKEQKIMMGNPAKVIGDNTQKRVFGIFD